MVRYILSFIATLASLNAFADDVTNTPPASISPVKDTRLFEMRTYHAAPGKWEALHARFRDFTDKLFVKHGMEIVGHWVPMNKAGENENTLVYILAFPSREARDKDWREFTDDLEWLAVKTDSEKDGKLIEKVDSVFMTSFDSAPINGAQVK